eukprot:gene9382-12678_t
MPKITADHDLVKAKVLAGLSPSDALEVAQRQVDHDEKLAEAEETGGAIQRFRGTTGRFGLSTNMDNRTDGTIPKPPIRTSVIKTSTKT